MAKGSGGTRGFRPVSIQEVASETISKVIADIHRQGFSTAQSFKIGGVEQRMKSYAENNNVELGSNDVYMSASQIAHSLRDEKSAIGKTVSEDRLRDFPKKRYGMDLYFDSEKRNFVYHDGENKYVVNPNYDMKIDGNKTKAVNYITASVSDGKEFNMQKYRKIEKK